ncbi:MAG: protein kinase [Thermoanaerobaculia bacterium]
MRCVRCGTENLADARHCEKCGVELVKPDSREEDTLEAPAEAATGELLFSRYRLLEELGRGGMGRVLRVLDSKIHEEIALKLIHPEVSSRPGVLDRFRNELKLARKVAHPNVCRVFDFGEYRGTPYITMEFVAGDDLGGVLEKYAPLAIERALDIADGICQGLSEAHRLGVVHRDLKPRNIQIDPRGAPHIMDFGLARSSQIDGGTIAGTMLGTPHYMSPEQVDGVEADHRADLYSLGVILFEMVVGERPFDADSPLAVALKHRSDPPPDPSEKNPAVPRELAEIILLCLEKSPDDRFESADELRGRLRAFADPDSAAAKPAQDTPAPPSIISELLAGDGSRVERSSFVDREAQLAVLERHLDQALEGQGQVVFVTGSPGSGKTQLTSRFVELAQQRVPELLVAGGKCNSQTGADSPYLPFRQTLELLTGDIETRWALGRIGAEQAMRLWKSAPTGVAVLVEEGTALPGTLLNPERLLRRAKAAGAGGKLLQSVERRVSESTLDVTAHEHEIHDQVGRVLFRLAESHPLIVVLDDLHWVDQGSASLFAHLASQLEGHRVLVIGTFRPAEIRQAPDGARHPLEAVVHEITSRIGDVAIDLDGESDRAFLDAYLDNEPNRLDASFRKALLQHTKGHALFTVELLRDFQDRGILVQAFSPISGEVVDLQEDGAGRGVWQLAGEVNWGELPARTEGVIAERMSRLSDDLREVLLWASIEGEEFTAEVLAEVLDQDVRKVVRTLSGELDKRHELVRAQAVRRSGGRRLSLYRFRHVLYQKYLYGELDEVEVSYRHEDVGNAMEKVYGEDQEELAVQLARHFAIAGLEEKAFTYSRMAGQRALTLSAYVEAISQFQTALEMLDKLPRSDERDRDELGLLLGLAAALTATAGYSAHEVERVCNRARKVAEGSSALAENFFLLYRLWSLHFVRGDADAAPELARQLDTMAAKSQDQVHPAVAAFARGVSFFWSGAQPAAAELLELAASVYDRENHVSRSLTYGLGDPLFTARTYRAWNLVLLGETDEGWSRQQELLSDAEELGEPFALGMALTFSAALARTLGRPVPEVQEFASRARELAQEHGFTFWSAVAAVQLGWCRAQMGDEAGIGLIQEGLALHEASGSALARAGYYLHLAEACMAYERTEEALEAIAKSLEMSSSHLDRCFDSDAYRLRALIEEVGDPNRAEASFREALALSESHTAILFQLKAAVDLARLHKAQGRASESRDYLEHAIGLFGDEDLVYLTHARKLLAELQGVANSDSTV